MNDVSTLLLLLVLGASHAAVFGVFLVAAAGKFAGCKAGVGVMCAKGAADVVLAALVCLVMLPAATQVGAAAAIVVGGGGWLREKISRNSVCNCFGLLTSVFHPWRNASRAMLVAGGAAALALSPWRDPAAAALWVGTAVGLSGLLAAAALALAGSPILRRKVITSMEPIVTLAPGSISPLTIAGTDAQGRPVTLQDLAAPGQPLALLLGAPGCPACDALKHDLAPLLPEMPFRIHPIIESAPDPARWPACLFDPEHALRSILGVKSLPALVLIDDEAGNLARPVACGPDAVKGELLRLLVALAGARAVPARVAEAA